MGKGGHTENTGETTLSQEEDSANGALEVRVVRSELDLSKETFSTAWAVYKKRKGFQLELVSCSVP